MEAREPVRPGHRELRAWSRGFVVSAVAIAAATACTGTTGPHDDAAGDGAGDGADAECIPGAVQRIGGLRVAQQYVGMQLGEARTVRVWVDARPGCTIEVAFEAEPRGVVAVPNTVALPAGAWHVDLEVEALAVGTATVRATYDIRQVEFVADVVTPDLACSGEAHGLLSPGGRVQATTGGLAGTGVSMPADPSLPALEVTLVCADDLVPPGWTRIGPAVRVEPVRRFQRELPVAIPAKVGLLPARVKAGDVAIFYSDGRATPRVVPFASTWLHGAPGGGTIGFATRRLGTFQAAYETQVGTRTRTRRYTYRGLAGVSMGAGAAAAIGLRHPERFDFLAPLGGLANWTYLLHYIHDYRFGGFCTALPGDEGDVGEHCAVPSATQLFEIEQEYENWFFPDGGEGQGGTFNRSDFVRIFRDLALAFGNPLVFNVASTYLPPGVPASWWELPAAERCRRPVVLAGFHDDEYNPDGAYPVITFCEGGEAPDDIGRWDPDGANDFPIDIALAVDVDGDTVRDPGEPILRDEHEPYDDIGVDAQANADEDPSYDPIANPDPHGEDFDYQFNPEGTEGNWRWDGPAGADPGEPWMDAGLDGVPGTRQQGDGGYDWGEGNGEFDDAPNVENFQEHDG